MGIVGALSTLPDLLVGLPAGAYADRWDRRRRIFVADTGTRGDHGRGADHFLARWPNDGRHPVHHVPAQRPARAVARRLHRSGARPRRTAPDRARQCDLRVVPHGGLDRGACPGRHPLGRDRAGVHDRHRRGHLLRLLGRPPPGAPPAAPGSACRAAAPPVRHPPGCPIRGGPPDAARGDPVLGDLASGHRGARDGAHVLRHSGPGLPGRRAGHRPVGLRRRVAGRLAGGRPKQSAAP